MQHLRKLSDRLTSIGNIRREPISSGSTTALCSTCSAIDVVRILRDGLRESDMVPLGFLPNVMAKANCCALCRLVATRVQQCWRLNDYPDVDLGAITCSLYSIGFGPSELAKSKKRCKRLYIHTSTRPLEITRALMASEAQLHLDIQLLGEDAHKVSRPRDFHGRRLKNVVDVCSVMRWVRLCETEHGDECQSVWWRAGSTLPEVVRMVDVKQMALVQAPRNCRYVALSYVWGGPGDGYWTTTANAPKRFRAGGLDKSVLPTTILDSIHFMEQVGEQYLWIDALCIMQDSNEDKRVQINFMDLIYSRASFTIFAAGGDNARAGLPGLFSGTRTCNQYVEVIQGLHLTPPFPSLLEAITQSSWNTRGWTYQEHLLSRRRLFFTQHQVYFECNRDVWCEDVEGGSYLKGYYNRPVHASLGTGVFLPRIGREGQSPELNYARAIVQYSRRFLTYESDIIAAMTALSNAFALRYEPAGSDPKSVFRYGTWMRYLDYTLLWQPRLDVSHSRREGIDIEHSRWPSWAWAGWKGAVHYTDEMSFGGVIFSDGILATPSESLVSAWHIVEEDGQLTRLPVERFLRSGNEEDNARERYLACQNHGSDLELTFAPPAGTLVFRTQRASFQVMKIDHGTQQDKEDEGSYAVFNILSADAVPLRRVGRAILLASTPPLSVHEFIMISRGGAMRGLHDEAIWGDVYYGCMLHVMAVGQGCDPRVRERIGLGIIIEAAWLKSPFEERVVLLS